MNLQETLTLKLNEIMTLLKQVALENGAAVVMATHDYHMIQNFPGEAIR
jgi:cell division transport system ATP-binding protein